MQSKQLALLAALVASVAAPAAAQFSWGEVTNQGALQSGDGTYYGEGQDAQGTCSFSQNFANTNGLAWSTGASTTIALNDAQFADSAGCGLCLMFRGTGAGLGTVPIPSSWQRGFVNNRCPECAKGAIDLGTSGDGRWKVEWYGVPCDVGSTPLVYSIVVSSYYWFSLVVSNTRVPITDVSVFISGGWLPLKRTNNNQWAYYNTNGPWQSAMPMGIRVTSCTGETVEDKITALTGNTGTVQFSASGSGGGMPASGGAAPAGNTSAPASPPAYPGSLSPSPTPPPAASPPEPVATPPAAVPPAVPASPPVASAPDGAFYINDYQQCGGTGGACKDVTNSASPCKDAAWEKALCRTPGFACTRYDASIYNCIPGAGVTYPPPMVWTSPTPAPPMPEQNQAASSPTPASPAPGSPAPGSPAPTSPAPASPAPASPTPSPSPVATGTVETASLGSSAASSPPPAASPSPVPAASPSPVPAASPVPAQTQAAAQATTTRSIAIVQGGQCGGTSQCSPAGTETDKVTCNNGPWAGAYCPDGFTCQPNPGPLIWTCMAANTATGGRRLLGSQ